MKTRDLLTCLAALAVCAALLPATPAAAGETAKKRFLIERTFPPGALDGLDAAAKEAVNAKNAELGVTWIRSYANADQTKTYCIYEGPSEQAVRAAADANEIPVDSVVEIPVDLEPGPLPTMADPAHRYMIERTFPAGALDGLDDEAKKGVNAKNAEVGVRWVGSYATADLTKTYCVYEGPSEAAVRAAADANAIPVDDVVEVPVELLPH